MAHATKTVDLPCLHLLLLFIFFIKSNFARTESFKSYEVTIPRVMKWYRILLKFQEPPNTHPLLLLPPSTTDAFVDCLLLFFLWVVSTCVPILNFYLQGCSSFANLLYSHDLKSSQINLIVMMGINGSRCLNKHTLKNH
jgi:hypothetical protein